MATDTVQRAPRNRTLSIGQHERSQLLQRLIVQRPHATLGMPVEGTILGDFRDWVDLLPRGHVDLLFLDPPYNLNKDFNGKRFSRKDVGEYTAWLDEIVSLLMPLLKPTATVYVCGDWFTSVSIFSAVTNHLIVRNRITWEREKGRGAKRNWKNSSEDIWYCTASEDYTFNVDAVKLRRKVVAPYTDGNGAPKDWVKSENGGFRDTHPSNLWTDITIPFWSMPENTDHPTQKSEKLLAKLILASTNPGDFVLDPFLGSGTTSVVAQKLNRRFLGIEVDETFALLAAKRLEIAECETGIQGFSDGVFWERNTLAAQRNGAKSSRPAGLLF
ncbi:MAG: site-specific DNA-methyltransferase [Thermoguttaceae bacterium]